MTNPYYLESNQASENGLGVIETINIGKEVDVNGSFLSSYAEQIKVVIKATKPTIIAIETKEVSGFYYNYEPEKYIKLLKVAVEVAQEFDVKVTNGGIEDDSLITLYFEQLKLNNPDLYSKSLLLLDKNKQLYLTEKKYEDSRKKVIINLNSYLDIYQKADIDYINIHWNEEIPTLIKDVFEYFSEYTGKKLISTEFIQPYDSKTAKEVNSIVRKLKLPCVIFYYAIEGINGEVLIDKEGYLTQLSKQLRNYIWLHHNKVPRVTAIYNETKNGKLKK